MKNYIRLSSSLIAFLSIVVSPSFASRGTQGAAFLDVPVGAGPAALGGAYTALADDAFAAVYNPGGLGQIDSMQLSGQHLSYLDSAHYESLSVGAPLRGGKAGWGGAVRYLGSGDLQARDINGADIGEFSSYYAAYQLGYGQQVGSRGSIGLSGKWIQGKIDDLSASAYAADLGGLYRVRQNLTFGAALKNLGSRMKFLQDSDPLPLAFHLGMAYAPISRVLVSLEGVYPRSGIASAHLGTQWRPIDMLALRAGYRTDKTKQLSALAGASLGIGLFAWRQEFAYAWLPYGDLGNTHYFSAVVKLGPSDAEKRNLIHYRRHRPATAQTSSETTAPEETQLMELLSHNAREQYAQAESN
jgi:hypothetical protein